MPCLATRPTGRTKNRYRLRSDPDSGVAGSDVRGQTPQRNYRTTPALMLYFREIQSSKPEFLGYGFKHLHLDMMMEK